MFSEEDKKKMMQYAYRRQEELKVLTDVHVLPVMDCPVRNWRPMMKTHI